MKKNYYDLIEQSICRKTFTTHHLESNWYLDSEIQRIFRNCSKTFEREPDNQISKDRGIVICGGGKYFPSAWVSVSAIRHHGCDLPIELWYLGSSELNEKKISLFEKLKVNCINALKIKKKYPQKNLNGFQLKSYSIKYSSFKEILFLDADNSPTTNPEYLFESEPFKKYGSYFFRDKDHSPEDLNYSRLVGLSKQNCEVFGLSYFEEPSSETGQILIDKERCWEEVQISNWWNEFSDYTYNFTWYDKDTFLLSWRQNNKPYFMIKKEPISGFGLQQFDHNNNLIFLHRCGAKWSLGKNVWLDRPQEELLHKFIEELKCKFVFKNL